MTANTLDRLLDLYASGGSMPVQPQVLRRCRDLDELDRLILLVLWNGCRSYDSVTYSYVAERVHCSTSTLRFRLVGSVKTKKTVSGYTYRRSGGLIQRGLVTQRPVSRGLKPGPRLAMLNGVTPLELVDTRFL